MRDRDLVRLYWPTELRPAFDALFDIDDAMGDVVSRSSEPALAAIKLAWWRERLEELDQGKAPAEPRLRTAAAELLPKGISGTELATLEAGWAELLQPNIDMDTVLSRGAVLFALAGKLINTDPPATLPVAGGIYAAGGISRRGLMPADTSITTWVPRIPPEFRRLTALAALAKRDLRRREPEATPGRAWALLRHRLTGRI